MILEVSAKNQDGTVIFKDEKQYKNIGISRQGKSSIGVWSINSYDEKLSTAFRPLETKIERFTIPAKSSKTVQIHAKIFYNHGLPTEFGKPIESKLVLQTSQEVVLGK